MEEEQEKQPRIPFWIYLVILGVIVVASEIVLEWLLPMRRG